MKLVASNTYTEAKTTIAITSSGHTVAPEARFQRHPYTITVTRNRLD